MFELRYTIRLALIVLGVASGCHSSPWSAGNASPEFSDPARPAIAPTGTTPPTPSPPVPEAADATPSPQNLQQVMAEVQTLGATDPEAQARLLAELQDADPSLWPLVIQNFRARLALANQLHRNDGPASREVAPTATNQNVAQPVPTNQTAPVANVAPPPGVTPPPPASVARLPVATDAALPPAAAPGEPLPETQPPGPKAVLTRRPTDARAAAPSPTENVVRASYAKDTAAPSSDDWRAPLSQAITMLASETGGDPNTDADVARQAKLRLLQLVAGHRDEALEPISSADAATSDFWANALFGLDVLLTPAETARQPRRAAEAKHYLTDALDSLGESASLEVRNLAFCREVQSYGAVKQFEKYEFSPGQRLLLYAEVDNFKSEDTPRGYHTSLRSSYQIFDAAGHRVDQQESTRTEEYCTNPRRDYFLGCDFHLPKRIYPGEHTLKLTVEDLKSHKVGESSIAFTIK